MSERFIETAFVAEGPAGFELNDVLNGNEDGARRSLEIAGIDMGLANELGTGWLTAAASEYNISSNIKDYVIAPVSIVVTAMPNRNAVAFPLAELAAFDVDYAQLAYETFGRRPIFYEHCFPKETAVLTDTGYRYINKIKKGTKVFTHKGRYQPVTQLFDNGMKWVTAITTNGGGGTFYATDNHPLEVVGRGQVYGNSDPEGRAADLLKRRATLDHIVPHFRPVSDICQGDYLVTRISIGGKVKVDRDLAFLTGVYAAEGSFNKYKGELVDTLFTIGLHEDAFLESIVIALDRLGYKHSINKRLKQGAQTIRVPSRDLASFLNTVVGQYSHLKNMRGELRKWNDDALKAFLGGYASGDGSISAKTKRLRIRTSSRAMAYDVQNAFARLGVAVSINKDIPAGVMTAIDPRYGDYAKRASYCIGVAGKYAEFMNDYIVGKSPLECSSDARDGRLILANGMLLTPVVNIKRKAKRCRVYNLEVAEDHTYTANNVSVHNCNQDHTKAMGTIFDVNMRSVPQFEGGLYKLNTLCGVDRTRQPLLANRVLTGDLRTWSMGASLGGYQCTMCGHRPTKQQRGCEHLHLDNRQMRIYDDPKRGKVLAHYTGHGIRGFETSMVEVPAWASAQNEVDSLLSLHDET